MQYDTNMASEDRHLHKSSINDIIENFQKEKTVFNSKLQSLKQKLNDLDLTNDEQKLM